MTISMLLTLTLSTLVPANDELRVKSVLVKGKIVEWSADGSKFTLKHSKGKVEVRIDESTHIQKHEVVKLKDVPVGTQLTAFARRVLWSRDAGGIWHLEQFVALVAGDYKRPLVMPDFDRNKPRWTQGQFSLRDEGRTPYLDQDLMHVGLTRKTVLSTKVSADTLRELKKSKSVYVAGSYMTFRDYKFFSADTITLPTKGIPRKEYAIILDPSKTEPKKKR